jgi:hypothetical protein
MRSSILSRSVVAVATLAIGSVALSAVPATAATASGVTRDQVLTVVNGLRAAQASDAETLSPAVSRAARALVYKTCDVVPDEDEDADISVLELMNDGDDAQGLVVTARVYRDFSGTTDCTFAAVATSDTSSTLSGTATVTASRNIYDPANDQNVVRPVSQTTALSGDAYTTPIIVTPSYNGTALYNIGGSAEGNATKTTKVTTSTKVTDKKSKAEKKAAKAKYDKRIKAAKKAYAKALDQAGSSKSKKAAAKKTYRAARAAAKASYKYATAGFKVVRKTRTITDVRPFSIKTDASQDNGPVDLSLR